MKITKILTTAALLLAAAAASAGNVYVSLSWLDGEITTQGDDDGNYYVMVDGMDPGYSYHAVAKGVKQTFLARIPEGHEVTMWSYDTSYDPNDKHLTYFTETNDDSYEWTGAGSDYYLAVNLDWLKYDVEFDRNGVDVTGSTEDMTDIVYTNKVTLSRNKFAKPGCTFAGWKVDGHEGPQLSDSAVVDGHDLGASYSNKTVRLLAQWTTNEYTVSFNTNGGEPRELDPKKVLYGQPYGELPEPKRLGYAFDGWFGTGVASPITSNTVFKSETDVVLTAHWKAKTYEVAYSANRGSGLMSRSVFTWDVVEVLQTNRFVRTGYAFLGWSRNAAATTAEYGDCQPVSNLTQNAEITLYAVWEAKRYIVTFDVNGGEPITPSTRTVTYDAAYGELPEPTREGCGFLGWYAPGGSAAVTAETIYTTAGDTTLTAHWAANRHTLTFDANGGVVSETNRLVAFGSAYGRLPVPTRTGYAFAGWYHEDGGERVTAETRYTVDFDRTVTAEWTAKTYDVFFNANSGTGTMEEKEFAWDRPASLPANAFTRTGYAFAGWSASKTAMSATYADGQVVSNLTESSSITLYAVWSAGDYTVRFDANGGTGAMAAQKMTWGAECELSANGFTRAGYTFAGWSKDRTASTPTYRNRQLVSNLTSSSETTLYAVWTTNAYTLTLDANGGTVSPVTLPVTYGGKYGTLPIPTRTGYVFAGWYSADGQAIYATSDYELKSDQTLTARWTSKSYVVYFDANGGTGVMQEKTMPWDAMVALPANQFTLSGHAFAGWSTSRGQTTVVYTDGQIVSNLTLDDSAFLYAVWTANAYKVTLDANGGTMIGTTYRTVRYGASYGVLPTPTRNGYVFKGWYDGVGNSVIASTVFRKSSDETLTAQWIPREYTVYFSAQGGEGTMASQTFKWDQTTTLPPSAFLRTGYTFTGWSTNSNDRAVVYRDGQDVLNLTENGSVTLYAVWSPITYVINFNSNGGSGEMVDMKVAYDAEVTLPECAYVRKVHLFEKWYDSKNNLSYEDRAKVKNLSEQEGDKVILVAQWKDAFDVQFSGNGETSGTMRDQHIAGGVSTPLSTNCFVRTGYTFLGWTTNVEAAAQYDVVYKDGQSVNSLVNVGETYPLFAVWTNNLYTVRFYPNGGEGKVYERKFTYGQQYLLDNKFERDGHVFIGWAKDPQWEVEYTHTNQVKNLTTEPNGLMRLFAKWAETTPEPSELEIAADCDKTIIGERMALTLQCLGGNVRAVKDGPDWHGNKQYIELSAPPQGTEESWLATTVSGKGVISFRYQVTYDETQHSDGQGESCAFKYSAETIKSIPTNVSTWALISMNIQKAGNVNWWLSANNSHKDIVRIDDIKWVPDAWPTNSIGLTYRLNDGTAAPADIFSNVTYTAGAKIGALPALTREGCAFCGWSLTPAGETLVTADTIVPSTDTQLYAQWIGLWTEPEPVLGLVYTGNVQTGVVETAGYSLTGNLATQVGVYTATATPKPGHQWRDGSTAAVPITWSIAKAEYDMSGVAFENATYTEDGTPKHLAVSGKLPAGVTVAYAGNGQTKPGKYQVTAKFTGDAANYEAISDMTATMTITERAPTSVEKPTAVSGLVYTGATQTGVADSTGIVLTGNVATNVGEYVAVATPADGYRWVDGSTSPLTIVWSIDKATYDMSGVGFASATRIYDGQPKSLEITGELPQGVTVSYEGNGQTQVGTYAVTAKFSGDERNYGLIADKRAVLTIAEPPSVKIERPTAIGGLVYTGEEFMGVPEGPGYAVVGHVATCAGEYVATVTLSNGCCWTDGGKGVLNIAWTIAKAKYDMSGVTFTNATYVADGQPKSLAISGKLPAGVTVSYVGNGQAIIGTYPVTAKFTGDKTNYELIADMTATLTITATPIPPPSPTSVTTNKVPTAVGGLIYNGQAQTGVAEGAGYTLAGNVATNAGDYVATATPAKDHVWVGGSSAPTNIAWSIAQAKYDMSGVDFKDKTVTYDGKPHSLEITGTLPKGVTVTYVPTNAWTEVGTYTVTAKFTGDETNYESIADREATLTIKAAEPGPTPTPVTTNAVPTAVGGLVYNGQAQTGVEEGAGYTLAGNVATNAGDYFATATPAKDHVWTGGSSAPTNIAWSIAKATYDMSGVVFTNATVTYDGEAHSLYVDEATLPEGVTNVCYEGNGQTEIGTYTVTAKFAGDAVNYEAIPDMTATLTIVAPPLPPDPAVGYVGFWFRASLTDLGVPPPDTAEKLTMKAEGLPAGLKLVTVTVRDEKNKIVGYDYYVEGVPTEELDGESRVAFVRITENKVQTLHALDLRVLPASALGEKALPDGTNKVEYVRFSLAKLWPGIAVNPSRWTVSGLPGGLKYATASAEVYGTPTKAGRFAVKVVETLETSSQKNTHVATCVIRPDAPEFDEEWKSTAYEGVYRASASDVTSASGLPTGVKYTAKDIMSGGTVVTEAHHFYGTPTKAGTFLVTVKHANGQQKQFLWTIEPGAAPTCEIDVPEELVDPETLKAELCQGVAYTWPITTEPGAKVTASGLPAGLKLVSTAVKREGKTVGYTYSVSGVPTTVGEYYALVKATLNGRVTTVSKAFGVVALPDWAQGTFDGGADDAWSEAGGGQVTFTVTKAGKTSGKWLSDGLTWTLSAASYKRYEREGERYLADLVFKTGSGKTAQTVTRELSVAKDAVCGSIASNELFLAGLNRWKQEPWKTIGKDIDKATCTYRPEGFGESDTITLKVASTGKVTVTGKFQKGVTAKGVSWYTASGSAVLCPQTQPDEDGAFDGVVYVCFPPKANTPLEAGYTARVPLRWDGELLTVQGEE